MSNAVRYPVFALLSFAVSFVVANLCYPANAGKVTVALASIGFVLLSGVAKK